MVKKMGMIVIGILMGTSVYATPVVIDFESFAQGKQPLNCLWEQGININGDPLYVYQNSSPNFIIPSGTQTAYVYDGVSGNGHLFSARLEFSSPRVKSFQFTTIGTQYGASVPYVFLRAYTTSGTLLDDDTFGQAINNPPHVVSVSDTNSQIAYVEISSYNWWSTFVTMPMDDFTYETNDGTPLSPVPEPGTLLLMGMSLFGLVGLRRKNMGRGISK